VDENSQSVSHFSLSGMKKEGGETHLIKIPPPGALAPLALLTKLSLLKLLSSPKESSNSSVDSLESCFE
jgi:hypothetical protein